MSFNAAAEQKTHHATGIILFILRDGANWDVGLNRFIALIGLPPRPPGLLKTDTNPTRKAMTSEPTNPQNNCKQAVVVCQKYLFFYFTKKISHLAYLSNGSLYNFLCMYSSIFYTLLTYKMYKCR